VNPQEAIESAYLRVVAELTKAYDSYIVESYAEPQNYEGITPDDVVVWLIEGLS